MKNIPKNAKIAVAMSGGVDSSVVAAILKNQGYNCVGVYLQFWTDPTTDQKAAENKCCSRESMIKAQNIAKKLNMPVCVLDVSKRFKEKIVDYFLEEHKGAKTPNPCVQCNRHIKFGALLDWAKSIGADYIATGHYARIIKNGDQFELHAGADKDKDQSYFLHRLNQDQLKHIIFPVGQYTKDEVRTLAKKLGIGEIAERRESQGVCFYPEKDHKPFLRRHITKKELMPGEIRSIEGEHIGRHEGLALYTIGQRKGIGQGGVHDPWFVVGLDLTNNTLVVGKNQDTFATELKLKNLTFPSVFNGPNSIDVQAKLRHRAPLNWAKLDITGDKATLVFDRKQRAITSGQSVVFYDGEKVIGGGEIE